MMPESCVNSWGLNFLCSQLLRPGELWPRTQAVACLWGVVCLANPIDYNSNLVAVFKSLRKRCNLQAKGTTIPDTPQASKQEFDLFF